MSNADIIRAVYDAFSKGDIPNVLGAMAQDIVWNEAENFPYADRNPYTGPDAVLNGVFARIGQEWEGFTVQPQEIIESGDTVIMLGRYTGLFKSTRKTINAQVVHVWRLKGGKIARFQQYADTLQVTRASGLV